MSKSSPVDADKAPSAPVGDDSARADADERKTTLGVRKPDDGGDERAIDAVAPRRAGVRTRFRQGGLKPATKAGSGRTAARGTATPAERPDERSSPTSRGASGRSENRAERTRNAAPDASRVRQPRRTADGRPAGRAPQAGSATREPGRDDAALREKPAGASVRGEQDPVVRPSRADDRSTVERADDPALVPAPEGVRLSKIMAERGLCSRREADAIIERGWVFVDGRRVCELGTRIDPAAEIMLAPEATKRQAEQVTILLHKPVGYVSGQPEPGFEPAVALIGPDNQFDRDRAQRFHLSHMRGLAPAGRLDIDSTGLLVLTQNGRIARQLIGEDSKVEKEYIVRVQGRLDDRGLALLNHGLELDGRRLRPAKVEWINEDQLRFVLREGRKRQIRRMCELVGLTVTGLKRTRIGRVKLSDLPLGQWRFLAPDESF